MHYHREYNLLFTTFTRGYFLKTSRKYAGIIQFIFVLLPLFFSSTAYSQWTSCNGPLGGDISSFATVGNYLFTSSSMCKVNWSGTNAGGLCRSSDSGKSWEVVKRDIFIYTYLASSGTNLYAGGQDNLYISKDLGNTWTSISKGLPIQKNYTAIGVVGTNVVIGMQNGGAYFSSDSGSSWSYSNPSFADRTVNTFLTVGNTIFAGTESGVFVSTDYGITWTSSNNGIKADILSMTTQGTNIFAGSRNKGEVYLSTDKGTNWTKFNTPLPFQNIRSLIAIDTNLFAGTDSSLYVSSIRGYGWTKVVSGLPSTCQVNTLFTYGTTFLAGTDQDVMISNDGGNTWAERNNGLFSILPRCFAVNDKNLFVGTLNHGMFVTTNNGLSWTKINNGLNNPEVYCLLEKDGNIFAGTDDGVFLTTNNGTSWTPANTGLKMAISTLVVKDSSFFAVAFKEGVFLSTDNGASWSPVTGLSGKGISSLVVNNGNLVAASYYGDVYLSTNNGMSWNYINNGFPTGQSLKLASIGSNIFFSTDGRGIFVTSDNGLHWNAINTGLSTNSIITIRAFDSILYTCTADGNLYYSKNLGRDWVQFVFPLKNTRNTDLFLNGTTLYTGTLGYGVWKLDITTLSAEDEIAATSASARHMCFPNPTTNSITINCTSLLFNSTIPIHYSIISLTGQKLIEFDRVESQCTISTEALTSGVFCLSASQGLLHARVLFSVVK